jgi:uncharacterized protein YjbI with pentapeptide repeats
MAQRTGTDQPRIEGIELEGLEPAPFAGSEPGVMAGDRFEGLAFGDLDIQDMRLPDVQIEESSIDRWSAGNAELGGLRLRDVTVGVLDAPVLRAARSSWHRVRVDSGRIGSADLAASRIDGLELVGMKLGFVNLRGATVADLLVRDCTIDELDLGGATLSRVAFEGCRIATIAGVADRVEHLDLRGASLERVDPVEGIRGATISSDQVYDLAPLLAAAAGLRVV